MMEQTRIVVTVPGKTVNPLNSRQSWYNVSPRAKRWRMDVQTYLLSVGMKPPEPPLSITMTRLGVGRMDQGCGLNASLKAVRDGVADWLGLDDADLRLSWHYAQERCRPGAEAVRIEISYRFDTQPPEPPAAA